MTIYFTQNDRFFTPSLCLSPKFGDAWNLNAQQIESANRLITINDDGDCNFTDIRRYTIQCYIDAGLVGLGNKLYRSLWRSQVIIKIKPASPVTFP